MEYSLLCGAIEMKTDIIIIREFSMYFPGSLYYGPLIGGINSIYQSGGLNYGPIDFATYLYGKYDY